MGLNLKIEGKDIDSDFLLIASELMNEWILNSGNSQYRITEIEFYYQNSTHNDTYTHGHKLQKQTERWYLHPSGIDLTFGSNEFYGGILIRAIFNLGTKEYTYGPINTLTELFSNLSSIYANKFNFGLVPDSENRINSEQPIAAPRVGLNPKKNPEMFNNLYRFFVMPKKKHDDKTNIANSMKNQGYSPQQIKDIWA